MQKMVLESTTSMAHTDTILLKLKKSNPHIKDNLANDSNYT